LPVGQAFDCASSDHGLKYLKMQNDNAKVVGR
jgi:hypothetical protein